MAPRANASHEEFYDYSRMDLDSFFSNDPDQSTALVSLDGSSGVDFVPHDLETMFSPDTVFDQPMDVSMSEAFQDDFKIKTATCPYHMSVSEKGLQIWLEDTTRSPSWGCSSEAVMHSDSDLRPLSPLTVSSDSFEDPLCPVTEPQALTDSALGCCWQYESSNESRDFRPRRSVTDSTQSYGSSPSCQSYASDAECLSDASNATGPNLCTQCGARFQRLTELERHAKHASHKPFQCYEMGCKAAFARRDALQRHRTTHDDHSTACFECDHCDRYRGPEAFKRRDHLVQHIRKVHPESVKSAMSPKYCDISTCKFSKDDTLFNGFEHRKDWVRHMREAHGRGTHECKISGCERVGAKGFARDRDLRLHLEKVHNVHASTSA